MINSFKNYLVEEEKVAYLVFGRMNPPTIGHEKLLQKLTTVAKQMPYRIYLSQSQDNKKNPLDYKSKVKFARKMFPRHARSIMYDTKIKTPFDALKKLYDEGFKKVVVVAGSDRVNEFQIRFNKYNGKKTKAGFYNFKNIDVISAGERDPDADGAEGMSASKMRKAAADKDFSSFAQGLPKAVSNPDAKSIYNAVRKGMGLNEQKEFKNHIQLKPVSDIREAYVTGSLYSVGDQVIIKQTNEVVNISQLGTNYVIVESNGMKFRKWLEDVEALTEREDPDIGHRKGSQPHNYHTGLKKSTKIARDRQFKKQAKMADDNPAAYKPAPGDKNAKTKPSKHTLKYRRMFGDAVEDVKMAKRRIDREKAADKIRHDRMMDRARMRDTQKKNRETQ
tara:strand:+ start:1516 stop:2688 length:1173 start_codon:yes stop_codon:yes gene_type:complete